MAMNVKIWGVRGSLPTPHSPEVIEARLKQTLRDFIIQGHRSVEEIDSFLASRPIELAGGFGGNTLSVEVNFAGRGLIIDAGSGIRRIGEELMKGPCGKGQGEVDILFTHFHWDHLIGLPFFTPLFIPGNKIRIHAVQTELESCVRATFRRPFFPVPFEDLRSQISFHILQPRTPVSLAGLNVTPYLLDHPDPCWGYRVEAGGKSYAHCVDTEGTRVSAAELGLDIGLYQNADLVLFDAQYTLLEAAEKMNWGHSAAPIGLEIALRENAKRILFTHHDPGASDEKIADAERQTHKHILAINEGSQDNHHLSVIDWGFAREGMLVEL
jgi:phosphoribosyl 1,2-cyclic phosphodiesterase